MVALCATVFGGANAEQEHQANQANAAFIVRVVNSHDYLLAMHEAIASLASGWDEEGALGPREPLSWETVGRMAMDYARAAIAQARGAE